MTAKQKASELVGMFTNMHSNKMSDYSRIQWPTAKLCALAAVEEVIKTMNFCNLPDEDIQVYQFWIKVRKEIKKL